MSSIVFKDFLLFALALGGLTLPWLPLLHRWSQGERLTLAVAAGLLSGYVILFGLYVAGLPLHWFWVAPLTGLLSGFLYISRLRPIFSDPAARSMAVRWSILSAWCLGWQCLVSSYSGAAWQGDWLEHYDRAHFFLARWPTDYRFLEFYQLPARPPLVNLWAAGLMSGSGGAFAHYQVFMTLLSTLVYLPLAGLVRHWGGSGRSQAVLLLVLMANPLFVQNATFPWTKLPAAFFVVIAFAQLLPREGLPPAGHRLVAAALALAGGMLAHYSAGPWICAMGVAWLLTPACRQQDGAGRGLLLGSCLASLLFLTWLGWSLQTYGFSTTLMGNTTLSLAPEGGLGDRLARASLNLWHTISPIFHVGLDHHLLKQESALGLWRDGWFLAYQLKLPWAFGTAGGFCLAWLLFHRYEKSFQRFPVIVTIVVLILGTATHSIPDQLGLTHVALQPLVLLGIAWLSACTSILPTFAKRVWAAGLLFDFGAGIVLHFGVQSLWLDRWFNPNFSAVDPWLDYTLPARTAFLNKTTLQLSFLADGGTPIWAVAMIGVAGTAALMWWRWEMASPDAHATP